MSGTDATSTARHTFTTLATARVKQQLRALAEPSNTVKYAKAMRSVGASLGEVVADQLELRRPFALVCTPEDADSLVEGMLESLPREQARLVCYWTRRRKYADGDVATVIQRFVDPRLNEKKVETVVVAKAIIASGCIVRTHLEAFLATHTPRKVLIAAPVMVAGAEAALRGQFRASISNKFEFLTFALDAKPKEGLVRPGVGGDVEERLGLKNKSSRFAPTLVQRWVTPQEHAA